MNARTALTYAAAVLTALFLLTAVALAVHGGGSVSPVEIDVDYPHHHSAPRTVQAPKPAASSKKAPSYRKVR